MMRTANNKLSHPDTGFSITMDATRWVCHGRLVFDTAKNALEQTRALRWPDSNEINCAGIQAVDSTAVAFFLAIKRRSLTEKQPLILTDVPAALRDLAALYGVNDLFSFS